MEIKISAVKTILFEKLNPLMNEYGLTPSLNSFSLNLKTKAFNGKLGFTFNSWFDEIQLMPAIKVDVKAINNIWKKFNPNIGYTYWMNLRKLEYWYEKIDWNDFEPDDKDKFKILDYEKHIDKCAIEVQRLFRKFGNNYMTDFSNPKGVDFLYNTNFKCEDENWHNSGFQTQSVIGLISAKLSENPNYDEIVEVYSNRINKHLKNETMNKSDIEIYFKVLKYISN